MTVGGGRDWLAWHDPYDDPTSSLAERLVVVRHALDAALSDQPLGPIRLLSLCAGQARDVLGVLPHHARRDDVRGRLVELDPRNADLARSGIVAAGLADVVVVTGDASTSDAAAGAVPADVVLVCGIFGNITDDDIARTVAHLPMLCAPGATVLWTRHRLPPDRTPEIRRWFKDAGFDEVAFVAPDGLVFGVGVHRLARAPDPFRVGTRLFTFVGSDALRP